MEHEKVEYLITINPGESDFECESKKNMTCIPCRTKPDGFVHLLALFCSVLFGLQESTHFALSFIIYIMKLRTQPVFGKILVTISMLITTNLFEILGTKLVAVKSRWLLFYLRLSWSSVKVVSCGALTWRIKGENCLLL